MAALFFAVVDKPERDGTLWVLDPFRLNNAHSQLSAIISVRNPPAIGLVNAALSETTEADKIVAVIADENNARMLAQVAAFTIHGSGRPLDSYGAAESHLRRYTVPASAKSTIRRQLWAMGTRRSTLFPDLDHLALELAELEIGKAQS